MSKGGKGELDFSRIVSHRSAARDRLIVSEMGVNKCGDLVSNEVGSLRLSDELIDRNDFAATMRMNKANDSKENRIKVMRIHIVWKHWRALYRLRRAMRIATLVRQHHNLRLTFRIFVFWLESTGGKKKKTLLKALLENQIEESTISSKEDPFDVDPSLHSPIAYYFKRTSTMGREEWEKYQQSERARTIGKWRHALAEGIDTASNFVGPNAGDRKCRAGQSVLMALSGAGIHDKVIRYVHHHSVSVDRHQASSWTPQTAFQLWSHRALLSSKLKSLRTLADGHFYLRSYKYRELQFISLLYRRRKYGYREKLALKLRYLDCTDKALHTMAEFTVARKGRRKLRFRTDMAFNYAKQQVYFDHWRFFKRSSITKRGTNHRRWWSKEISLRMVYHHRMVMKMLGFISLEKLVSRSKEKRVLSKRTHDVENSMRTYRTRTSFAKWYSITTVEYKRLRRFVVTRKYYAIPPLPETLDYRHQLALTQSSLDREWWQRIEDMVANEDHLSLIEKQHLMDCSAKVVALIAQNTKVKAWEVWIVGCLTNRHLYFSILRKALKKWRKNVASNLISKDILRLSSQHYYISKTTQGFSTWLTKRINRVKKIAGSEF